MATYEFIIKNESGGGSSSPTAPDGTPKKPKGTKSEGVDPRKVAMASYGIAKQVGMSLWTHEVNMVELRTGNAEYQQRLQFQKDVISRGFNIVESIALGFAVGHGVGAIIGAATSIGMMGIQLAQNIDRIETSKSVENISIGLADVRAGAMENRQGRNS